MKNKGFKTGKSVTFDSEDEEHEHMIVYMAPVVHNLKVFFCIPLPFFIKTMAVCFTVECALNVFQMVAFDFECADQYSDDCELSQTLFTLAIFLKLISSLIMVTFAFKKGSTRGKGCIVHALIIEILASLIFTFVRPLADPSDTTVDIYGWDRI